MEHKEAHNQYNDFWVVETALYHQILAVLDNT